MMTTSVTSARSARSTTTALTLAEDAFQMLVGQSAPLAFDARCVSGLPDRYLPLGELRDLLRDSRLEADTTDVVWRQLAGHVRDWGSAWVVGAVGVALPGLSRLAAKLSRDCPKLMEDIHSEVLAGFLRAVRTDNLQPPRVWLRLCWAAWRAGLRARRVESVGELPLDLPVGSRTPHRPYGHPDLVLGCAVAAGFLTAGQAELIGATRLGGVLIDQVAAECGVSGSVLRMRRKRAERTLVAAIRRGDLAVGFRVSRRGSA